MSQEHFDITRPIYRKMGEQIIRFRFPILLALVAFSAYLFPYLGKLQIGNSVEAMMPEGNAELARYTEFKEQFGGENLLVVAYETDDIFTPESLRQIRRLTEKLESVEYIDSVTSITNFKDLVGTVDTLETRQLVPDEIPEDRETLEAIRKRALANEAVVNNLVSENSKIVSLVLQIFDVTMGKEAAKKGDNLMDRRITKEIRKILDEEGLPEAHIAGMAFVRAQMAEMMGQDFRRFLPPTFVFIFILLVAMFRTVLGVFLPIFTVTLAVAWTLAFVALSGKTLTVISTALPPLVLVSTIGDAIHFISEYYEDAHHIPDKHQLTIRTFAYVAIPCFLTSVTTMFGYAANYTSPVMPVKEFGIFSAIGVGMAYLATMTVIPIVLNMVKHPQHKKHTGAAAYSEQGFRLYKVVLKGVEQLNLRHRKGTFIGAFLIMAFLGSGIARIKIDTNMISYFKDDSAVRRGFDFIEGKLAGVNTLNIDVRVNNPNQENLLKEPRILRKIEKLQQFLETDPSGAVSQPFSIVDIIKSINKAMNEDREDFYKIPETRQAVAQFILLLEMAGDENAEMLEHWVDYTYTRAKVATRVNTIGSSDMVKLTRRIKKYLEEEFNDDEVHATVTGQVVLFADLVHLLLNGQIYSILLAFSLVAVCMMLVFRSFVLGAISMIPNIIPIVVTLGIMGWSGITLNVATVMISCVALGIAVDGTTHYYTRFKKEFQIDQSYDGAMSRALHSVGPALIFTNVIVIVGFSVVMLSNFKLTFYFGLLMCITMFGALWGDLIVGPIALILFRPKIAREVYAVEKPVDPLSTIPKE